MNRDQHDRTGSVAAEVKKYGSQYSGLSPGTDYIDAGRFDVEGSKDCDRLEALIDAISGVFTAGPIDSFVSGWKAVIDPSTNIAGPLRPGRTQVADTYFEYGF